MKVRTGEQTNSMKSRIIFFTVGVDFDRIKKFHLSLAYPVTIRYNGRRTSICGLLIPCALGGARKQGIIYLVMGVCVCGHILERVGERALFLCTRQIRPNVAPIQDFEI